MRNLSNIKATIMLAILSVAMMFQACGDNNVINGGGEKDPRDTTFVHNMSSNIDPCKGLKAPYGSIVTEENIGRALDTEGIRNVKLELACDNQLDMPGFVPGLYATRLEEMKAKFGNRVIVVPGNVRLSEYTANDSTRLFVQGLQVTR